MSRDSLLRAGTGFLFLLYPFLVYLGLQTFQPRALAGFLLIFAGLRFSAWRGEKAVAPYWIAAAVLVVLFTFVTGTRTGLYLYPLLVNLVFFSFFAISLVRPPTVIETIARRQNPDLPDRAIAYTRRVTMVWCLFFVLNGAMSAASILLSEHWWLLYNGLISYLLIGMLLLVEYLVRLRVMAAGHD